MADPIVWENIPKSQADPTTIDEAIGDAMDVHNADSEAHMAALGSLGEHRENSVIDHPAESIPNDKTFINSRRYIAIVDPNSGEDFDTVAGAVDYAARIGGGDIFIRRGNHFITDDLAYYPNISLQGEGKGESVLYFIGGTSDKITFRQSLPSNDILAGTTTVTVGSDNVTFTIPLTGVDSEYIGKSLRVNSAYGSDYAEVIAVVNTTTVKVAQVSEGNGSIANARFQDGADFTNNSSVITLTGSQTIEGSMALVGTNVYRGSIDTGIKVVGFIQPNQILLSEQYSGTTGFDYIQFRFPTGYTVAMDGITFVNQTGDDLFGSGFYTPILNIQNCAFEGGDGYIRFGYQGTYIADCDFECDTTNAVSLGAGATFERCRFTATVNASRGIGNDLDITVRDCIFNNAGFSNCLWFNHYGGVYALYNNTFLGCDSFTLTGIEEGIYKIQPIAIGNRFSFTSGDRLTLTGPEGQFIGNRVETSSSSILLDASSSKWIVVGNVSKGGVTNSGSSNQVANNVTL